ncbi:unnamed protein product [Orchesella dallaii]|uniref:Uncharacterized protein n=1 Tax=Orchesella dallaii TaxID=48710 RepID=A0ABP1RPT1_9HEXA
MSFWSNDIDPVDVLPFPNLKSLTVSMFEVNSSLWHTFRNQFTNLEILRFESIDELLHEQTPSNPEIKIRKRFFAIFPKLCKLIWVNDLMIVGVQEGSRVGSGVDWGSEASSKTTQNDKEPLLLLITNLKVTAHEDAQFERTCNSNQIRDDELLAVLKGEVALVQGVRHRGDTAASQNDRNWNEFRGADGDTSGGTKVIKMEGRILKSLSLPEEDTSDIDHKSMMLLLNQFCIQKGIPLLPENIGQNRSGGGGRTRRQSGSSQAPAGDKNKTGNKNEGGGEADRNSRRNTATNGGRGGAGGGKRPPPPDSTSNSEPDSPRSIHVSESSEQVTSSSTGVKTEDNSRRKRKGRGKSETSVLISNEESVAHRPKPAKLIKLDETDVSEGIPSPSTNVAGAGRASTMRKESSARKKKQKGSEIVAPETRDSLTPEADLSTSTKKKSKGNRAGKSVQIEETGELEGESSTTPADNYQKKELKRRSSYRRRLKSRSKSREEDAILITELSDISHVLRKERGNEWLEWTSSEDEAKDQDEEEEEQKKKQKTMKPTRPGGTFRPPIGTTLPPPLPGQPHCFSLTDTSDNKYFIKCPIPSKTGPWADLPYISYPSIFEQVDKYTYRRILKLKSSCNPDLDGNSLPSSTSSGSGCELDIKDCARKPFKSRIGTFFEDECKNPILYGFNTRWYPELKLRVVVLSNDRVACCIDYQLGDPIQSRKQALVCNNNEDRTFKCEDKTDPRRTECRDSYILRWKALASDEAKQMSLESDRVVVACMCKELEYAQKRYPGQPSGPACRAQINTYHL